MLYANLSFLCTYLSSGLHFYPSRSLQNPARPEPNTYLSLPESAQTRCFSRSPARTRLLSISPGSSPIRIFNTRSVSHTRTAVSDTYKIFRFFLHLLKIYKVCIKSLKNVQIQLQFNFDCFSYLVYKTLLLCIKVNTFNFMYNMLYVFIGRLVLDWYVYLCVYVICINTCRCILGTKKWY